MGSVASLETLTAAECVLIRLTPWRFDTMEVPFFFSNQVFLFSFCETRQRRAFYSAMRRVGLGSPQ